MQLVYVKPKCTYRIRHNLETCDKLDYRATDYDERMRGSFRLIICIYQTKPSSSQHAWLIRKNGCPRSFD